MKKLSNEEFNKRLKIIHPKENLQVINYETYAKDCQVKCLSCGSLYTKKGAYFLDKRKISICKKCFPTQEGVFKQNYTPPLGYEIIESYKGAHTKILVRHECGFIWKVKPGNLNNGKGCPKCSKKFSKGERKIIEFLDNKNINYIFQYPIEIKGHHLVIDFYLPDHNIFIEYNGEQHYQPVNFFGGEEKFQKQIENDKLKKDFFKDSLIEISYLDFDNIFEILESSTTISKESRLK